jgi:RNA binding exosome subunit
MKCVRFIGGVYHNTNQCIETSSQVVSVLKHYFSIKTKETKVKREEYFSCYHFGNPIIDSDGRYIFCNKMSTMKNSKIIKKIIEEMDKCPI